MFVIIGWVVVMACVLGGYIALGGKLAVLFQPFELVIIGGAAVGAFIAGNPKWVIKSAGGGIKAAMKGPANNKDDYLELLSMMYTTFKLAKTKGNLALERISKIPKKARCSPIFPDFWPITTRLNSSATTCAWSRWAPKKHHELEALMDEEMDIHHHQDETIAGSVQGMADGLPALGIVAAVLGVIKTMGSITEPPECSAS